MPKLRARKRKKVIKDSDVAQTAGASSYDNEESKTITTDTFLQDLKNAIASVQNLPWTPAIYVYNVDSKDSIYAVDINKSQSAVVCAFENTSKIFVKMQPEEKLPQIEDENLLLNYNTLKVAEEDYEKVTAHLSSDRYLTGHSLPVTGLKFVESKQLLLSCSLDGSVKAWSTENFVELKSYFGTDFFCDIDVSCKSTYFATCGVKGTVSLYSFEMDVPEMQFSGHTEDVNCVRFHPNGIYFATASADKTIKLWCTQTGNMARTFQDDKTPVMLAFSPDGHYLASYSGGVIKIWDLASGELLTSFNDLFDQSSLCHLCFSEFGGILASGGSQKKLKLWDVKNLSSSSQEGPNLRSLHAESRLFKTHSLNKAIKCIKFDENNFFTCVTG